MTDRCSGHEHPVGDDPATDEVPIDDAFETVADASFEQHRQLSRYLTQETRHHIIQIILGHPAHLLSLTELDYYVQQSRSTIRDQLTNLQEHRIIDVYTRPPGEDDRDLPSEFWGLTPFGVELLSEYNYLRGVPLMRAIHEHTRKTDRIDRHETAPRPLLPKTVAEALELDETEMDGIDSEEDEMTVAERRESSIFADTASDASDTVPSLDTTTEDERTFEDLFDTTGRNG